jgi:pteridine reductase
MSLAPVALITGGARRIGAEICRSLHAAGFNIAIHCRNSKEEALALAATLNAARENSASVHRADLSKQEDLLSLAADIDKHWGRLDTLINNASSFYSTPLVSATLEQWDDLMSSNLKAPFFLAQTFATHLKNTHGCIINIADIHADRPLSDHPIYCAAKAGNVMLVKSLAKDMAPDVRVNGVAPGAILWPEDGMKESDKQDMLGKIPLEKLGQAEDIARTVKFLVCDAPYISGQILSVDGGRSVNH